MNARQIARSGSYIRTFDGDIEKEQEEFGLMQYWDIIYDGRWLTVAVTAVVFLAGLGYALLSRPVYEANILIQVEDSATSAKSFLGETASLFDVKTPATAELEIIRSRMVLGEAVDKTHLFISASPKYVPLVGPWLARNATELSVPGVFGIGGWVSGTESIDVETFNVPASYQGTRFNLTLETGGRYRLSHSELKRDILGTVGEEVNAAIEGGNLSILVRGIEALPGAKFNLIRYSRLETIEALQERLKLSERGRQSGMIDATLQDTQRLRLSTILNEIGKQYVRQNVERKAAEAEKTLAFLDLQLPQFKRQLDQSEEAYNRYRNTKGTVALDEEAKLILAQGVDLQAKLTEAQQRRVELTSRFTTEHPSVKTLDTQIVAWTAQINSLNSRVRTLPTIQQDAIRLERDVKVNNELYQQLRNNALQLQLIREGKIGNVRLIDPAATPEEPVRPKKLLTTIGALCAGMLLGVLGALARSAYFRGIRSAQEIETKTGLNVYSTVPLSEAQQSVARDVAAKRQGLHLLAESDSQDAAVESLRSLRTALQFAMLESPNNRIVISGPTPGVGKSFISANFAAVLAAGAKRVLLIDADLRKGHLNQYFGADRDRGLSELVAGTISLEEAARPTGVQGLDFIPTGSLPPNPAELMASMAMASTLNRLSELYDLLILDTAPVLVAADTVSIAAHAGAVLLVARAEQTQLGELHECARRLSHAGIEISGVIFNGIDLTRRHYGGYSYGNGGYRYRVYQYGAEER